MRIRPALVMSFTLLLPTVATTGILTGQMPKESSPDIEVRLSAVQSVIRPGETLKFKVEVWNVGTEDIIIAQNVDATFGNSDLELFLEVGSVLQSSNTRFVADGIPEPNPDFEKTFLTNWLTLNKAHYYGTYVYMDPIEFPQLRKSGHYRVRAEYSSRGISSVSGWNGGYLKQEDIAKLPFKAWKGTVNSNFVNVQVSAPTKKTTDK
jgi:hypothetical protein